MPFLGCTSYGPPVNKEAGESRQDLQDIELRLLNETANLKLDSKRARQRLESARSCMAKVKFDLAQVEEALRLDAAAQFPAPSESSGGNLCL
jgi:hypothetical protein